MQVLGISNKISFERRPTKDEEPGLKSAVTKAYDAIGAKERVVITHGSCFPDLNYSSCIGSPYGSAAKEYIKFLSLYGFNGNQLGPGGELEYKNGEILHSPYNSSAFAKNRLFVDLEELTGDKYGKILSEETFNKITKKPQITDKNFDMTDFEEAVKIYDTALNEAYKNFKANLSKGQPQAISLNKEFNVFLQKHNNRLEEEGIFKILSKLRALSPNLRIAVSSTLSAAGGKGQNSLISRGVIKALAGVGEPAKRLRWISRAASTRARIWAEESPSLFLFQSVYFTGFKLTVKSIRSNSGPDRRDL